MKFSNKNALILSILFSHNNIFFTLIDLKGNTKKWVTGGSKRTNGVKKNTPVTLFHMSKILYTFMKEYNSIGVYLRIKGINKNKLVFIKHLKTLGLNIFLIQEKLLQPYGGCKKSKSRRL